MAFFTFSGSLWRMSLKILLWASRKAFSMERMRKFLAISSKMSIAALMRVQNTGIPRGLGDGEMKFDVILLSEGGIIYVCHGVL